MTFLEIVRAAALESGTMGTSGTNPAALASATGRGLVFKNLAAAAWQEIQIERNDWNWMRTEFVSANLISGTSTYTPADILGGAARFRAWLPIWNREDTFTIYETADGIETEGYLRFVPWPRYRREYATGNQLDDSKPQAFTIDDQSNLRFTPAPDTEPYTLRGMYWKGVQTLAVDGDIPECPADYHRLIVFRTLLKAINYDESAEQFAWWLSEEQRLLGALVRDQVDGFYL